MLLEAGVKNGLRGHHHGFAAYRRLDFYLREHLRFELEFGVGKPEADFGGAGGPLEIGVDIVDGAGEGLPRQVFQGHGHRLPHFDPGQFVLVNLGIHPNRGKIGHLQQGHGHLNVHALGHHALGDDAVDWGHQDQILSYLSRSFQSIDLPGGDIEISQAAAGGRQQAFGPLSHLLHLAFGHGPVILQGQEVFFLGRNQFRTVDREQSLAFAHRVAGGIDVEAVHPAVYFGGDGGQIAFVVSHQTHGHGHPGQRLHLHFGGAHPHGLDGGRGDGNDSRGFRFPPLIFIDGYQVHAHGRFPRFVPDIGGVHGRDPVFDFTFLLGCGPGDSGAGHRHQVHAADGAFAGFIADDLGMHGAAVKLDLGLSLGGGRRRVGPVHEVIAGQV